MAESKLQETIAKLEASIEEAREATREAHAATKDLRRAETDLRRLHDETAQLIETGAHDAVQGKLQAAADEAIEEIGPAAQKTMREASDKVIAEFEELRNLLMTGTRNGVGQDLTGAIVTEAARRNGGQVQL